MLFFDRKERSAITTELARLLGRYRGLLFELTRREIKDRYAGQAFGAFWTVGHPLALMGVYVFVFVYVFRIRFGDDAGTARLGEPIDYTAYLLSGIVCWLAFTEAMSRGVGAIVANANLVKQVAFPIEVLPVKVVLATTITQAINLVVILAYSAIGLGTIQWTWLLLPLLVMLQTATSIGLAFLLSSLNVYLRDLKDIVQVLCLVGTYLVPAFYHPRQIPELFRPILYLNPFSYFVWCYQDVCCYGAIVHPWAWLGASTFALVSLLGGYCVFRKLRLLFGNVL